MPLNAPLDQFADRLIRNGELRVFVQGLMERGVTTADLLAAAKPEDRGPADDRLVMRWYKQTLVDLGEVANSKPRPTENVLDRYRFHDERHA